MNYWNEIGIFGEADANTLQQALNARADAKAVRLMADNHLGYSVPVGGVVAYEGKVSPIGVGYDIGCGNKAVRLDMTGKDLRAMGVDIAMDLIWNKLSFGIGRKNPKPVDHALFDSPAWSLSLYKEKRGKDDKTLRDKAAAQLGTIGSGNHYVDLFIDEKDRVWVGVHFGSRGLGHGTASYFMKVGGGTDAPMAAPLVFDVNSDIGAEYIAAMQLAGEYAYAGRDWVCRKVSQLLGAQIKEEVHNHHNFAWKETHDGKDLWVVRKGATPAFPGQKGFIGGSMSENAVIVEGVDSPLSKEALYSTVHGAGRAMSRTEAAGKVNRKTGEIKREGRISTEYGISDATALAGWLEKRHGVVLRGAGLDEAPQAYKRLPEVLAHHEGTIKLLHVLTPVGVAMAGKEVFDPYSD